MKPLGPLLCGSLLTLYCASALRADDVLEPKATTAGYVSIQLPKGWVNSAVPIGAGGSTNAADSGPRTLIVGMVAQRDKDATGMFQATLAISVDAAVQLNGKAQQALVAQGVPNYKPVESPSDVTLNGIPGVMFGGTFSNGPSGGLLLRSRQYMLVKSNQLYVITFTSLNSRWAAYLPLVEASVATFSVKSP